MSLSYNAFSLIVGRRAQKSPFYKRGFFNHSTAFG